jgi:hypothetical protein
MLSALVAVALTVLAFVSLTAQADEADDLLSVGSYIEGQAVVGFLSEGEGLTAQFESSVCDRPTAKRRQGDCASRGRPRDGVTRSLAAGKEEVASGCCALFRVVGRMRIVACGLGAIICRRTPNAAYAA